MEQPAQSDTSVPNVSGVDLSVEESKQPAEQAIHALTRKETSEIEEPDCPEEHKVIS